MDRWQRNSFNDGKPREDQDESAELRSRRARELILQRDQLRKRSLEDTVREQLPVHSLRTYRETEDDVLEESIRIQYLRRQLLLEQLEILLGETARTTGVGRHEIPDLQRRTPLDVSREDANRRLAAELSLPLSSSLRNERESLFLEGRSSLDRIADDIAASSRFAVARPNDPFLHESQVLRDRFRGHTDNGGSYERELDLLSRLSRQRQQQLPLSSALVSRSWPGHVSPSRELWLPPQLSNSSQLADDANLPRPLRATAAISRQDSVIPPEPVPHTRPVTSEPQPNSKKRVREEDNWTGVPAASLEPVPNNGKGTVIPVLQEQDRVILTPFQVLLRSSLEYFTATEDDISVRVQGRRRAVLQNQVGIRCRYCSHKPLRLRSRVAVYYPRSMLNIYQGAQNIASLHFEHCTEVPPTTLSAMADEKNRKVISKVGRPFWADSCKQVGIYEDDNALWLRSTETNVKL